MKTKKLRRFVKVFCGVRSVREMAAILKEEVHALELQAAMPHYQVFRIRKRSGGKRLIENPSDLLKAIQRKLNRCLQVVYYFHKSPAAYGFVMSLRNKPERNIVTNAARHLNSAYLMNIDFKDFFHAVSQEKVIRIFRTAPFNYPANLATLLSKLCCYKQRLPMGAPTSPVLSNFYTRRMDEELHQYAVGHQMNYTRYADDMSFSGNQPFEQDMLNRIKALIAPYGLPLNEQKTKFFTPECQKVVTGIYVSDRLKLSPDLLQETAGEIRKLQTVMEIAARQGRRHPEWIKEYKQRISGYLQFAKQVLGKQDETVVELYKSYNVALNPPHSSDPVSWSKLPYVF